MPFDYQHIPYFLSPTAICLGSLQVRWYGLMYLLAAGLVYLLSLYRLKTEPFEYSKEMIEDFLALAILWVVIGGRIGYVLFYNLNYFIKNPIRIFSPFDFSNGVKFVGIYGMSYHGGLIGVLFAFFLFCKKRKIKLLSFIDFFVPAGPLGYMFGRIGNFLNGELYGRVTNVPWGMYFPRGGYVLRHPSQLYEAFFEGLFLFVILWKIRKKRIFDGFLLSLYLIGYGLVRFFIEFVREPDEQLGLIAGPFSMGQILCMSMFIMGVVLFLYKWKIDKSFKTK